MWSRNRQLSRYTQVFKNTFMLKTVWTNMWKKRREIDNSKRYPIIKDIKISKLNRFKYIFEICF